MPEVAPISKETNAKISNMSFVCACLVVTIHIWPHPTTGAAGMLDKLFGGGIAQVAVPYFFCVSGYLLASKIAAGHYRVEVLKRLRTLVIPFFIWGLISVLASFSCAVISDILQHRSLGTFFPSSANAFEIVIGVSGVNLAKMPLSTPLWYLRTLYILVLLSPCLAWLISKLRWFWIAIILTCYGFSKICGDILPDLLKSIMECTLPLKAITAFSIGILLRSEKSALDSNFIAWLCVGVGVLIWVISTFICPHWWLELLFIATIGYALWHFMPDRPFLPWLLEASFPMYLMHAIFLGYFQILLIAPNVIPNTDHVCGYLMHGIGSIFLSIAGSYLLHRYFPKVSSLVFGGR